MDDAAYCHIHAPCTTQYGIVTTADAADRRLTLDVVLLLGQASYSKLLPLAEAPEAPARGLLDGGQSWFQVVPFSGSRRQRHSPQESLLLVLQLRAPPIQTQRFFIARASYQAR